MGAFIFQCFGSQWRTLVLGPALVRTRCLFVLRGDKELPSVGATSHTFLKWRAARFCNSVPCSPPLFPSFVFASVHRPPSLLLLLGRLRFAAKVVSTSCTCCRALDRDTDISFACGIPCPFS